MLAGLLLLSQYGTNAGLTFGVGLIAMTIFALIFWLVDRYRRRLPRIALAAVVMGAVLWGLAVLLQPALGTDYVRYAALLGLIVLGALSYFGTAHALGGLPMADLRRAVRR